MNDINYNLMLKCNDNLRQSVEKFIEIFVEYYGEEQREFIAKRFNEAQFIGYLTEGDFDRTLDELEKSESNRLYDEILFGTNLGLTKDQLFKNYSFRWANLHPIDKYINFYNYYILGPDGREKKYYEDYYRSLCNLTNKISFEEYMNMVNTKKVPSVFENVSENKKQLLLSYADISNECSRYERMKSESAQFLSAIDPSVTVENIEDKMPTFSELNMIVERYNKAKKKFELFKAGYKEYYDIQEYNKSLNQSLNKKYYREYLYEVMPYLPEQYRNKLQSFLDSGKANFYLDSSIGNIVGYSLNSSSLLEYFTSLSNNKLSSNMTSEWEKKSIKEGRIEYFKAIGIDLGDDYNSYLQLTDVFPKCWMADEFVVKKDHLKSKLNREYYNNIIPQKYFVEEAKGKGFLEYDPNESAEMYMLGSTCVCPNIVKKDGKYDLAAKVRIKFDPSDPEPIDHFIIHELNHLYELHLVSANESQYDMVCGWDILTGTIRSDVENIDLNRKKRKYELFNEIINEKIAQDISLMMEKSGLKVLGETKDGNYKNTTSYEYTNYLVSDFFEKYKKEILQSRRDNNIQVIYDAVGKENFDDLNELFRIHNEHFAGFGFYGLLDDLDKKKDTERTKIYYELINRRNEILEKMDKHYKDGIKK